MYTIAVVEDEKNLASLVEKYLVNEGYEVKLYTTGEEVIENLDNSVNLWILDIMLPGMISGYDLIKKIRSTDPTKPIIFTSARDQDIDRIMGLELGSDDYLAKPYSIRELVLRVKNLLTRSYQFNNTKLNKNEVVLGNYIVNKEHRNVTLHNETLSLTSKEFDLLIFLMDNPSKAFSRDQILNAVWGEDYFGSDRVVDDLLRRLRQKMPELKIETIYGYGYRFVL